MYYATFIRTTILINKMYKNLQNNYYQSCDVKNAAPDLLPIVDDTTGLAAGKVISCL